ncbi:PEPxxWA-CTERM sorting domain-containing protein [Sphingobium nicotianae]|uniref:PEPxxWA-CTERM sorting domain-containing protein n=1 Tax=Sphingobium nicotianae TaxID=2782607 RepID=UPI0020325AA9|nr:PEPxxWA-CTERM sorting domain-containing protein [Sphingobium nicotianae]
MNKLALVTLAAAGAFIASPSFAATQIISNISGLPVPAGTTWGVLPGENSGTVAITTAAPRSGNASLELTGDRTRVQTGVQYAPATNMGLVSQVQSLIFDWQVAADSARLTYTPALRLLVQDGAQRSELIWEGVYNAGTNGFANTNPAGAWYSTTSSDVFWQYVAGIGPNETGPGNSLVLKSIADWVSTYSSSAFVAGLSVGAGSGALPGYHAFVDNVTFTTATGSTTYNFDTAAVPEPATWGMMIGGLALVGASMRRRKMAVSFA